MSVPPGPPRHPGEPPLPGGFPGGVTPPPPGEAERLVAKSGFVVYESGNSVFDESVLVYLARPRAEWPDFDVFDHVGRPLAFSRAERRNSMMQMRARSIYFDQRNNQILGVKPNLGGFSSSYQITGVASAEISLGLTTMGALSIGANNEQYGKVIANARIQGMNSSSLQILDETENRVGAIKSFGSGGIFTKTHHFVVSVEPGLQGELRRLLVALPTVIATVRRQSNS